MFRDKLDIQNVNHLNIEGGLNYTQRKVHPITCHAGTEGEKKYSCTFSLTSALD